MCGVHKDGLEPRGLRAGWCGGHFGLSLTDAGPFHTRGRLSAGPSLGVVGTRACAELTPSPGLGVRRAVRCLPLTIHLPRDAPESAKYLSFKDATLSGHHTGQDDCGRHAVSELEVVDLPLLLKVPRVPPSPARCPGLPARGVPCTPALGVVSHA